MKNHAETEDQEEFQRACYLILNHNTCQKPPTALESLDEGSIHDYRVSLRTLRSHLRTFAPVLRSRPTRILAEDLRMWDEHVPQIRNCDVMENLLLHSFPDDNLLSVLEISERIALFRAESCRQIMQLQQPRQSAEMTTFLQVYLSNPPVRKICESRNPSWKSFLVRLSLENQRDLLELAKLAVRTRNPERLHKLRICAKRYRYQYEALDLIGVKTNPLMYGIAKEIQHHIGLLQDVRMLSNWVSNESSPTMSETRQSLSNDVVSQNYLTLQAIERILKRKTG